MNADSSDMSVREQSGFRFVVADFCFLLVLVKYLDRAVMSFAIKPIESELHIEDGAFGLLMPAFAVATLATNGLSGFLLD